MKEYRIEIVRGHLLVSDDRGSRVLVDTGSPMSFHSEGVIALGDRTFNVPGSLMGIDSTYVTENVGTTVDGLVGMDILGGVGLLIDVPGKRIVVGYPTDGRTRVPSRTALGYLSVDMTLRGQQVKVILDTGAPTSYVSPSLTEGLAAVDNVEDFNPAVPGGKFVTPLYAFPAAFAGKAFEMRAGHLPGLLQLSLPVLGVSGVVGMELLKRQSILIADGGVWV